MQNEHTEVSLERIEILKEDVAMRAELVGVPAPSDYGKFFDYGMVRKIYRELKSSGWKPTP